jgi:uncharacterized protein (DUF433 family)
VSSHSETILEKHIERNPQICGGKPCVAGTRIRVWDIHVWHDLKGQTPEEIVAAFPQLTLASVHAALAYYFDQRETIEQQMREAGELVDHMTAEQGPTRYTRLRNELLEGKEGHDDSVSFG